jgi:acetylornithine deacetylase
MARETHERRAHPQESRRGTCCRNDLAGNAVRRIFAQDILLDPEIESYMWIDADYTRNALTALVRINSVNPRFTGGTTSEREIAAYVADALTALDVEVTQHEPEAGRVSVVGRLPGPADGPALILYAHMDTVGVEGMEAPFDAVVRDGRLHGRGSYDMKGGLAACLGAVHALGRAPQSLPGDVILMAVADEEVASIGLTDLLSRYSADAAIVTEPTDLALCVAHKGFSWIEVRTRGRAAHGSRFEEGIDANLRMGRFLARLEDLERALRTRPAHPLLGPPSLHAGLLAGGTGASVYAAESRVEIERRTIPGETEVDVVAEIVRLLDALARDDPSFRGEAKALLTREPFETTPDGAVARAVTAAASHVLGRSPPVVGMSYWMDAALFHAAGIDTVVIGPTGAGAHAVAEWVDIASVIRLAEILSGAIIRYPASGAITGQDPEAD